MRGYEGSRPADCVKNFVVKHGIAAAGLDMQLVDSAILGNDKCDLYLTAPALTAGNRWIVQLSQDRVAYGAEIGMSVVFADAGCRIYRSNLR